MKNLAMKSSAAIQDILVIRGVIMDQYYSSIIFSYRFSHKVDILQFFREKPVLM